MDAALNAIGSQFSPQASGVASWARFAVEHLYYLADLDRARIHGPNAGGHTSQMIDYAHGQWATSTAITAIDRCAAALGHGLLPARRNGRVYDHRDLVKSMKNAKLKSQAAAAWVTAVEEDPEYAVIQAFRNPLTHHYLTATGQLSTTSSSPRNALEAVVANQPIAIPVDQLVSRCCVFAKGHLEHFFHQAVSPGF